MVSISISTSSTMLACSIPVGYVHEIHIVCLHVQLSKDMCTTFDLHRICTCVSNSHRICVQDLHSEFLTYMGSRAYMFNSHRICARILCYIGLVPTYSIPGGYVHHSNFDRSMPTYSIPIGYVHKVYILMWTRYVPAYSIPVGYVHKVCILTCLTIFG